MKKDIIERKITGTIFLLGEPTEADSIIESLKIYKGKTIYFDGIKDSRELVIVEMTMRKETDEEEKKREKQEKIDQENQIKHEKEELKRLIKKYPEYEKG